MQPKNSHITLMVVKRVETLEVSNLNLQHSRMAYTYRAEGGFEPLDFYIPTGLKPAPRTLQAHPRLLYQLSILFI